MARSATRARFALQFSPREINKWASRNSDPYYPAARKAGIRIASGDYRRRDFERIVELKTKRVRKLLKKNKKSDITDALELATKAKRDRSAIAVLTGLSGISVPVASALLAMMQPDRFTIIDFRALRSLGHPRTMNDRSIEFYLAYLDYCRNVAAKHGTDLRTLDRALWQYDKMKHG
jgi:hypothetical protein